MRLFLFLFLVFFNIGDGLKKASQINYGVQLANKLYHQKKFSLAATQYKFVIDSWQVKDEEIFLNLAHALFLSGDKTDALKYYQRLRNNANPKIQAAALNQMGLITFSPNNPEKALYLFKKAIVQDPQNDIARYNYELIKKYKAQNPARISRNSGPNKKLTSPKPEEKPTGGQKAGDTGNSDYQPDLNNSGSGPPQTKPRSNELKATDNPELNQTISGGNQNQAAQGEAGGAKEGVAEESGSPNPGSIGKGGNEALLEKERQMQTLRQRLSKTDLTAEKATMLLEAMRQAELQYLQQLPRPAARRPDKNKPDW